MSNPCAKLRFGAKLLVRAGEFVPLDGEVLAGRSSLNLSHLTGESHPIFKMVGDEVPAGALNMEGALTIIVTRTSADSTLKRIINLIAHAQEAKPKLERFIDRFGDRYAMSVMGLFFIFRSCFALDSLYPLSRHRRWHLSRTHFSYCRISLRADYRHTHRISQRHLSMCQARNIA